MTEPDPRNPPNEFQQARIAAALEGIKWAAMTASLGALGHRWRDHREMTSKPVPGLLTQFFLVLAGIVMSFTPKGTAAYEAAPVPMCAAFIIWVIREIERERRENEQP